VLSDTEGNALDDGSYTLDFKLYDQAMDGGILWEETLSVDLNNGVFNTILGNQEALNLPFDRAYWLGIAVDGAEELSPRTPLTASPYSLGGKATELQLTPGQNLEIQDAEGNITHVLNSDGTGMHAGLMNYQKGIFLNTTDTALYFVPREGGMYIGPDSTAQNIKGLESEEIKSNSAIPVLSVERLRARSNGPLTILASNSTGQAIYGFSNSHRGVFGRSNTFTGVKGQSNTGTGVAGQSISNTAVFGTSQTGSGVLGTSKDSIGVYGQAFLLPGVLGSSTFGCGVEGNSDDSAGVLGKGAIGVYGIGSPAGQFEGDVIIDAQGGLKIDRVDPQEGDKLLVWADDDKFVKYRSLEEILADDADKDPTNELQILNISGNTLSITNGNSIEIPTAGEVLPFDGCLIDKEFKVLANENSIFKVRLDNTAEMTGNFSVTDDDGVAFEAISISDKAIVGRSNDSTGVFGHSDVWAGVVGESIEGVGVDGFSSLFYGVVGTSDAALEGAGVFGQAEKVPGVFGLSTNDIGVHGESRTFYGVRGFSRDSIGVVGESNTNIGVFGASYGPEKFGILGEADLGIGVFGKSKTGAGIKGISMDSTGVFGKSDFNDGVYGYTGTEEKAGVFGESENGYGVQGISKFSIGIDGTSTENVGVSGFSEKSSGVSGVSEGADGVSGISMNRASAGVTGSGENGAIGVQGFSTDSIGVYGVAFGENEIAILGESTFGIGVKGRSDIHHGIYGISVDSAGVLGESQNFSGVEGYSIKSVGVYGFSENSYGIQGESIKTNGVDGTSSAKGKAGVFGLGDTGAIGVWGASIDSTGVYGNSNNENQSGVFGESVFGIGVRGYSEAGRGMSGKSTSSAGVFGESLDSIGIYGVSKTQIGVFGESTPGIGVKGMSVDSTGVIGQSAVGDGVYGFTGAEDKIGVFGESQTGMGVKGKSVFNIGIEGRSDLEKAIYGKSVNNIGIKGESEKVHGIEGFTPIAGFAGVYGNSPLGKGVFGSSTNSIGVHGKSTTNIGVLGEGEVAAGQFNGDVLIEMDGMLKIDKVEKEDSDKILVWADNRFVKYRDLSGIAGDPFGGILCDQDLILKSGVDEVARIDVDGNIVATGTVGTQTTSNDPAGVFINEGIGNGLFVNSVGGIGASIIANDTTAILIGNSSTNFAALQASNSLGTGGFFTGSQAIVGQGTISGRFIGDNVLFQDNAFQNKVQFNTTGAPGTNVAIFSGDVLVQDALQVTGMKNFVIDHPLDPENKKLRHFSVESDELSNVYSGNVVLDGNGEAVVSLPDWFEALNTDFRYQLTCVGGFANVYIAEEISDNQFKISGGKAGLKISWEVTGVRHDRYALETDLSVELSKN
jgi:hypothetical protein